MQLGILALPIYIYHYIGYPYIHRYIIHLCAVQNTLLRYNIVFLTRKLYVLPTFKDTIVFFCIRNQQLLFQSYPEKTFHLIFSMMADIFILQYFKIKRNKVNTTCFFKCTSIVVCSYYQVILNSGIS